MGVFQEAEVDDVLYYKVGDIGGNPIFRNIKKISPTEYQEFLYIKGEYNSERKNINEFPQGYELTKTKPTSRNKGGKRTNRLIKKNNKSRKIKSIKNRRK